MQADEIFQMALSLTGETRARFINEKCGSDLALKAEVENLLNRWLESQVRDQHTVSGSSSDNDGLSFSIDATRESDHSKKYVAGPEFVEGDQVGNYTLRRPLGQGGMGGMGGSDPFFR